MKNKLTLLLLICCALVKAQSEFVPAINRATGSFTNTGPKLPNVEWVYAAELSNGLYTYVLSDGTKSLSRGKLVVDR